jgi:hypothetical protein
MMVDDITRVHPASAVDVSKNTLKSLGWQRHFVLGQPIAQWPCTRLLRGICGWFKWGAYLTPALQSALMPIHGAGARRQSFQPSAVKYRRFWPWPCRSWPGATTVLGDRQCGGGDHVGVHLRAVVGDIAFAAVESLHVSDVRRIRCADCLCYADLPVFPIPSENTEDLAKWCR